MPLALVHNAAAETFGVSNSEGNVMMRNIFIPLLLVISVSLYSSPIMAETRVLKGTFEGRPEAKLTIRIQRVGGAPFKVKRFTFENLPFTCFGDTPDGTISGTVRGMKINKRQNPFNQAKQTNVYFSKSGQTTIADEIGVFITGITNNKATKTSGNFGMSFGDGCSHSRTLPSLKFLAN
jgi:hypothetical protein